MKLWHKKLNPKHIIICEAANIGDVILTLPLCALLKQKFPELKITFLTRNYAAAITEASEYVDETLVWDELAELTDQQAIEQLQQLNADTILHVRCTPYLAWHEKIAQLAYQAKIPNRIGYWDKVYTYNKQYCNYPIRYRRKGRDKKHHSLHGIALLKIFGIKTQYSIPELAQFTQLHFSDPSPENLALLDDNKFNLIIHPGSNKHGREWSEQSFIDLIKILPKDKFKIFISGAGKEQQEFTKLLNCDPEIVDIMNKMSLTEFCRFVAKADGLIAASTGPLHIAAACGIDALGLFSPRRHKDARCWHPLGPKATIITKPGICSACEDGDECPCMRYITAEMVKNKVMPWLTA